MLFQFIILFSLATGLCAATTDPQPLMSDDGHARGETREKLIEEGLDALPTLDAFIAKIPTSDPLYYRFETQMNLVLREVLKRQLGRAKTSEQQAEVRRKFQKSLTQAQVDFMARSLMSEDNYGQKLAQETLELSEDKRAEMPVLDVLKKSKDFQSQLRAAAVLKKFGYQCFKVIQNGQNGVECEKPKAPSDEKPKVDPSDPETKATS